MDNFSLIQFIVAFAMFSLMWSLRKVFIKFFTNGQKNTFLGDAVFCTLMIFLPSFVVNILVSNTLTTNLFIFGSTYELYGFLLYKIEKIDGIGVFSYFRNKVANV